MMAVAKQQSQAATLLCSQAKPGQRKLRSFLPILVDAALQPMPSPMVVNEQPRRPA